MKTLITEDENKVVYKFSHNDCDRIVTYSKTIYIQNEAGEQQNLDQIIENEYNDWMAWLGEV
jgi:hypothetical protein